MLFPHYISLPMTIEVLEDIKDMFSPDSTLGFDTLGNLHVNVEIYVGLRKGQDQVHLVCNTPVND